MNMRDLPQDEYEDDFARFGDVEMDEILEVVPGQPGRRETDRVAERPEPGPESGLPAEGIGLIPGDGQVRLGRQHEDRGQQAESMRGAPPGGRGRAGS